MIGLKGPHSPILPRVSMTLEKGGHNPLILGNDPFLKGLGDSRYLFWPWQDLGSGRSGCESGFERPGSQVSSSKAACAGLKPASAWRFSCRGAVWPASEARVPNTGVPKTRNNELR